MRTLLLVLASVAALAGEAHAAPAVPSVPADVVAPASVALPALGRLERAVRAAAPCPPPDPCAPKDPWSFSVGVAFSLAQGNADSFDFTADGLAKYEQDPWALKLKGTFAYGEKDGDVATEAYHATAHVERKLNERLYVFGNLDWDRDVPARLEYRWTAVGGLGYVLVKGRTISLKGELGAGYTWEKRTGKPSTGDPAAYLGLEYEKKWASGSSLFVEYKFVPNLNDFDLSVMTWDLRFAKPLCAEIDLTISLRVDHVIDPPAPTKKTDVLLAVGLRANF